MFKLFINYLSYNSRINNILHLLSMMLSIFHRTGDFRYEILVLYFNRIYCFKPDIIYSHVHFYGLSDCLYYGIIYQYAHFYDSLHCLKSGIIYPHTHFYELTVPVVHFITAFSLIRIPSGNCQ